MVQGVGVWGLEPGSPMIRIRAKVVTGACDNMKTTGRGCGRTQEENPGVCIGPVIRAP